MDRWISFSIVPRPWPGHRTTLLSCFIPSHSSARTHTRTHARKHKHKHKTRLRGFMDSYSCSFRKCNYTIRIIMFITIAITATPLPPSLSLSLSFSHPLSHSLYFPFLLATYAGLTRADGGPGLACRPAIRRVKQRK